MRAFLFLIFIAGSLAVAFKWEDVPSALQPYLLPVAAVWVFAFLLIMMGWSRSGKSVQHAPSSYLRTPKYRRTEKPLPPQARQS